MTDNVQAGCRSVIVRRGSYGRQIDLAGINRPPRTTKWTRLIVSI